MLGADKYDRGNPGRGRKGVCGVGSAGRVGGDSTRFALPPEEHKSGLAGPPGLAIQKSYLGMPDNLPRCRVIQRVTGLEATAGSRQGSFTVDGDSGAKSIKLLTVKDTRNEKTWDSKLDMRSRIPPNVVCVVICTRSRLFRNPRDSKDVEVGNDGGLGDLERQGRQ